VELQGANSHLIEQFPWRTEPTCALMHTAGRRKTGSVPVRHRRPGDGRHWCGPVGRTPFAFCQYGGIHDSNPMELFSFVIRELSKRRIAYLHLIEAPGIGDGFDR